MAQDAAATAANIVLRPHRHLFSRGILATFALTTPVFAVVYWLTLPAGGWGIVLFVQILVVIVSLLAVIAYFGTTIQLSGDKILERGFFGRVSEVPVADVRSVLLLDMYQGSTMDTQPQLFICGEGERLLIRMRGQFWSRANMEQVIDWLDLPVTTSSESLTIADLRRTSPHLLYWFERWPQLRSRPERPVHEP